MAKTFHLGRPELAAEVEAGLRRGGSGRVMQRLTALRLAMSGEHTLEEIGAVVGRSRRAVAQWMHVARAEGVAAVLASHQGRGQRPRVAGKAWRELRQGLTRGRWRRAKETRAWLEERHHIKLSLSGMRYWLKKAGES